jgi:hypothetical protein
MDDATRAQVTNLMEKGFAGTIFLQTDDCQAAYEEVKGRGVEFLETPEERGGRRRRSPPGDRSLGRLVVLAERYWIDRVLTLDHRHFRLIRTSAGKTFTVLPRLG